MLRCRTSGVISTHRMIERQLGNGTNDGECLARSCQGIEINMRDPSPRIRYYLGTTPTYPSTMFREVPFIPLALLEHLLTNLSNYNAAPWSTYMDVIGRIGICAEVKCMVFLRMLGTGRSLRDLDDAWQMQRDNLTVF